MIHRAIPYPLMVCFVFERQVALSVAHKRFSLSEKGAIVAEEIHTTIWIHLEEMKQQQQEFLNSLDVSSLPHTHYLAFYTAVVERVIALDCAGLTGNYYFPSNSEQSARRQELLRTCHDLESKIAMHRIAIQKETQFNRKVELNATISELQVQLGEIVDTL